MARRKEKGTHAFTKWRDGLTVEENMVASAAISLFKNFIYPNNYTGGCYHMAFLLSEYLLTQRGIIVKPVVGFVNDGTDEIMISHAWVEFNSKKTDVSLAITEEVPPGSLVVLDQPLTQGECEYSYHLEEPPASRMASEARGAKNPLWAAAMIMKDAEHARMQGMVSDRRLIREYLDSAPPGLSFEAITALMD